MKTYVVPWEGTSNEYPQHMFSEEIRKLSVHYKNTPIQIYRKFHLQKLKIFR